MKAASEFLSDFISVYKKGYPSRYTTSFQRLRDVFTTSATLKGIDVERTSCVYWDSTNQALRRLTKNWKAALDNNLFTGALLINMSEAVDCIPHDLLIAKFHAYGLKFETVAFLAAT